MNLSVKPQRAAGFVRQSNCRETCIVNLCLGVKFTRSDVPKHRSYTFGYILKTLKTFKPITKGDTLTCHDASAGQLEQPATGGNGDVSSKEHGFVRAQSMLLQRVQTDMERVVDTVFATRELSVDIVEDCKREYEFSRKQENIFVELEKSMLKCSTVLVYLALSDLLSGGIVYFTDHQQEPLELFSSCADAFHELICAAMIRSGSRSFRAVYQTRGNDIRNLLEGLLNLARVLQEVGILSGWLAIIQVATASAVWTPVTAVAAVASVVITAVRLVTWSKPHFIQHIGEMVVEASEKVAEGIQFIFYLGGVLRRFARQTMKERTKSLQRMPSKRERRELTKRASFRQQYEFSHAQEQVIRSVLAGLRLCSLAKWGQGLSELLYLLANAMTGNYTGALASAFDSLDALAVAGLLTLSMNSFDKIITTEGQDISLLLEGLGPVKGIAKFFSDYAEISLFLCLAQVGQSIFHMWYGMGLSMPANVASMAGIITVTLGIVQQLV